MGGKAKEYTKEKWERKDILAKLNGRPEAERTFADDRLGLSKYGDSILHIIRNNRTFPRSNDNCSYVIGIDGPWGSGKTTFLSMLYSELKKHAGEGDEAVLPIYYNAWRGDFWNNAFAPFFDCIWNSIPDWKTAFRLDEIIDRWHIEPSIEEEAAFDIAFNRECESVMNIGANSIRAARWTLEACLTKPVTALMDSEYRKKADVALHDVFSDVRREDKETKDYFPEYTSFQLSIFVLQKFLASLTGELSEAETSEKRTVAVFVDELDRCRPDFAVQTLEIIKHMFNVERIVFVIATDIGQLSHTVKCVYGEGFDSVGYLERFFNVMTMLPQGTQFSYEHILDDVQNEIIKTESKGDEGEADNCESSCNKYMWDPIKTDLSYIAKSFDLSLREYRRVLLNMHLLETTVLEPYLEYKTARVLYFYYLAMKYKFPLEFAHAVFKRDASELDQKLPKHRSEEMHYIGQIRAEIIKGAARTIDSLSYERYYSSDKISPSVSDGTPASQEWGYSEPVSWGDQDYSRVCYSYVLYPPDISHKNNIGGYTLLEYLYRKIEMFDLDVAAHIEPITNISERIM